MGSYTLHVRNDGGLDNISLARFSTISRTVLHVCGCRWAAARPCSRLTLNSTMAADLSDSAIRGFCTASMHIENDEYF